MKIKNIVLVCLSLMSLTLSQSPVEAVLKVGITKGQAAPTPIAITPVFGESAATQELSHKMTELLTADLNNCGLFKSIDPKAFMQTGYTLKKGLRFEDWRLIKAQLLTVGSLATENGKLKLEIQLYDVLTGLSMGTFSYTDTPQQWRKIAHKVGDLIYQRVTGEEGYFATKIVYRAETGGIRSPVYKLAIIDQDGANNRYLSQGDIEIELPVFSPTSQMIAYSAYKKGQQAKLYLMNVETGLSQLFNVPKGISFAPRFSPDGKALIFSTASGGTTSIYVKSLHGNEAPTRLTKHIGAIDTSPSYAPDGKRIVFESDFSGSRHVYVMNSDGSNIERISHGKGKYMDPIWSPRGDLIAFIKQHAGEFYLGVMKPDGTHERMIEKAYFIEKPTWATNGRVILYKKDGRMSSKGQISKRIYSVDLTGHHHREVGTPTNASQPAWSPSIQ